MVTKLELIDTAIKVGFGAVISGITTYFVATRTHRNEMRRSLLAEKKELLRQSALKLEKSGSLMNQAILRIYDARQKTKAGGVGDDQPPDLSDFVTAYNECKEARSLCFLIGQQGLGGLMEEYCESINELQKHFRVRGFQYEDDFVGANTDRMVEVKNAILVRFGEALDSIHAQ